MEPEDAEKFRVEMSEHGRTEEIKASGGSL